MEKQAEDSVDLRAKQSGSMGGGASGPRDMPTGGRGQDETSTATDPTKAGDTEQNGGWGTGTQASSNAAGQQNQETGQPQAPPDKGQEEIENYGSRSEDEPDELPSPSSQLGRAAQSGGTRRPAKLVRDSRPRRRDPSLLDPDQLVQPHVSGMAVVEAITVLAVSPAPGCFGRRGSVRPGRAPRAAAAGRRRIARAGPS